MASKESRPSEGVLRQAVLAGDERAWQALYDGAFEPLHAYVAWRCGGRADWADDLVQETWMIAVRRLASFDPEKGPFAQWLRGIAANLLRNHFRLRRPATGQGLPDRPAPFDADASHVDQADRIGAVLAQLPALYEDILRSKYLDQRTVAEIASDSGQSVKAIESLLTRAREAFRAAFSKSDALNETFREAHHDERRSLG
jgi:RNA polymerase sigma-70 factor (ECF subfamily)